MILMLAGEALIGAGVRAGDLLVATEGGADTIVVRCRRACTVRRIADGPAVAHAEGHVVFVRQRGPRCVSLRMTRPAGSSGGGVDGRSLAYLAAVAEGVRDDEKIRACLWEDGEKQWRSGSRSVLPSTTLRPRARTALPGTITRGSVRPNPDANGFDHDHGTSCERARDRGQVGLRELDLVLGMARNSAAE